jgi:hypothetical protein
LERPNRPESRGRSGSFIGRWNVRRPRQPAKAKIVNAKKGFSSLKIINKERKIRIKGIIVFIAVKRGGSNNINAGVTIRIAGIAKIEPYKVKIKAS